jgi:hypothetical protein
VKVTEKHSCQYETTGDQSQISFDRHDNSPFQATLESKSHSLRNRRTKPGSLKTTEPNSCKIAQLYAQGCELLRFDSGFRRGSPNKIAGRSRKDRGRDRELFVSRCSRSEQLHVNEGVIATSTARGLRYTRMHCLADQDRVLNSERSLSSQSKIWQSIKQG